jgi:ABC-type sulfate transport system substrate-binding protein
MERIRPKNFDILYFSEPEQIIPVEFTEKEYQEAVQRLKEHYPQIGRRVYKTRNKSWKQVFEEMYDTIKKLEKLESKTSQ